VTERLLILGTHAFAEEVTDLVAQTPGFVLAGYVENQDRDRCREPLGGLPVHWIDDLEPLAADHLALCAIGTTRRFRFTRQAVERGMRFATLVHPRATVLPSAELGAGCTVSVGAVIAARTRVGEHTIINRGALVGHHTQIGAHCFLGPGCNVAGRCRLGDRSYVAMSATVVDGVSIGEDSVVGAGAVVTKDVPPGVQVVGVPARIVKETVHGR
jgi:UDP-perosamine 4-acetyltransferase